MKFLACSRCFSNSDKPGCSRNRGEITNPLVVTKRPEIRARDSRANSRDWTLGSLLNGWPRLKRAQVAQHARASASLAQPQYRHQPQQLQRRRSRRPQTRTQRLIRMYEARSRSPELGDLVIKPPEGFAGDDDDAERSLESHQNFKNKLNSLDFRRMNTVALEEPSEALRTSVEEDIYRRNTYREPEPGRPLLTKYAKKTLLEDYLRERANIEQAMIELLNGQDRGSVLLKKSRNEDKRVRFRPEPPVEQLCVDLADPEAPRIEDVVGDDGKQQESQIKLSVDPTAKLEDVYVERKTTFFKDKTVEDKALVVKIGKKDRKTLREEASGLRPLPRDIVFQNFGKMSL